MIQPDTEELIAIPISRYEHLLRMEQLVIAQLKARCATLHNLHNETCESQEVYIIQDQMGQLRFAPSE